MQKQKGFILPIMIVVAVIAVLGAAGYFAYKQYSAPKQPEQIVCTQEAKLCPDGSSVGRIGPNCEFADCPAITDETAGLPIQSQQATEGWKTYKNGKSGYEIKYPADLIIEEYPINQKSEFSVDLLRIVSSKESNLPTSLFINVFKNTKKLTVQQLADQTGSAYILPSSPVEYKIISRGNIMFDGVEGVKIITEASPKNIVPNTFIDNSTIIYIVKGDFVYTLGYVNKSTDVMNQTNIKNYDSVRLDQMLSTFKFTPVR